MNHIPNSLNGSAGGCMVIGFPSMVMFPICLLIVWRHVGFSGSWACSIPVPDVLEALTLRFPHFAYLSSFSVWITRLLDDPVMVVMSSAKVLLL